MGANLNVNGHVSNAGHIAIGNNGTVEVNGEFVNTGSVTIGERELVQAFSDAYSETMKTSRSVLDFGTTLLNKLNLLDKFIQ